MMPKPYPFQLDNVATMLANPRKRLVLDETGLGKSVTAILAAQAFDARRVLIVTLGMVRPGWLERLQQWWPERAEGVGSITMGKVRKGLSRPAMARLAAAYSAPIQVVSYDLLTHVDPHGWDMIILDEIHELVSYRSHTSKLLRYFFACSPNAVKIGLTATLLSAEPKNTWNLLHLWEPQRWGRPNDAEDPPWSFQRRYCQRHENEYGVVYRGLNEANAVEFQERIGEVSMRTLRYQVAELLPPIDCAPLVIDSKDRHSDASLALDWLHTAAQESTHVSVFFFYRDSAEAFARQLCEMSRYKSHVVGLVTGESTPEKRHRTLAVLRGAPRAILVGTMDSLGTGITLTAFRQYLILEARSTPNKLVQLLGRFSRLDSQEPARGFVLLRQGRDDDTIATLRRRLADFNTLVRAGQGEQTLLSLLEEPTELGFDRKLDDLIASFRGDVDEDEEAEGNDAA